MSVCLKSSVLGGEARPTAEAPCHHALQAWLSQLFCLGSACLSIECWQLWGSWRKYISYITAEAALPAGLERRWIDSTETPSRFSQLDSGKCGCQDLVQTRTSIKAVPGKKKTMHIKGEGTWNQERVLGVRKLLWPHRDSTSDTIQPSPGNKTQGNLEWHNKNIPFVYGVWSWTPSTKEN